MRLDSLAAVAGESRILGDGSVEVADLAYDSRKVGPGTLFFCVPGEKVDGHEFAAEAVKAGAAGLVVQRGREAKPELAGLGAPLLVVRDVRAAMGPVAACFERDPTAELTVIGITGTNGKTTTAFLVRQILEASDIRCGLLGTVEQVVAGKSEPVERTTPEAVDLQAIFRRMLDTGDRVCVMEVSSHALELHRCDGIHFDVALFTNLTQDHLDFHKDLDEYFAAKRLLFEMDPRVSIANIDDRYGQRLARELPDCITFSAAGIEANLVASDLSLNRAGAEFTILEAMGGETIAAKSRTNPPAGVVRTRLAEEVRTRLPGEFNVENALAAFAAATRPDVKPHAEPDAAAAALAELKPPPGRMEPIDEGQPFSVLVDYAHTPDSLENVLRAARGLGGGRVISVFGAGGDRDRGKRPLMGRAGVALSDLAVITSDNPRSEHPDAIVAEVAAGAEGGGAVELEVDRREAIALALGEARPGDAVVIAGKGHEQGQEFEDGRRIPFDDRQVAREELRKLAGEGRLPAAKPR